MTFNRKYLAAVHCRPTARLVFSANNRPRFSDKTGGIWRRMLLVPFQRKVPRSERVLGMNQPDWWYDSGEVPGIFNWALKGLYRLWQNGDFTEAEVCENALNEYRREVDHARDFLEEHCEEDTQTNTGVDDLYKSYVSWAKASSYRPLGKAEFGKAVLRLFPKTRKRRLGPKGDRFHVYEGILLAGEF